MTRMPLSAGFLDRRAPLSSHKNAFLAFYRGRMLMHEGKSVWVQPDTTGLQVYLGMHEGKALFAQDLSHIKDTDILGLGEPTDLWLLPKDFAPDIAAVACQGQHILRWHAKNQNCSKCGAKMEGRDLGRHRHCPQCESDVYPRTDPAVIMLVQSPDLQRVVLAHSKIMPPGLHSLLAGYVEAGETLEDTVARETFEEAGLRVGQITYVASQPWAMSGSLMCGFTCVSQDENICIDADELESAAWYSRADLDRVAQQDGFIMPRRQTIARHILELWRNG